MKSQDKKSLQTKTREELLKLLQDAQEELSVLQFDHAQQKVKNTSSLTNKRKEIAVLQTILRVKSTDAKAMADKEGGNKNG